MYITRIELKNIRSITDLKIEMSRFSESIILTGDNGSGKSTILRCIAMGISDEDSAASVLRELSGDLVRGGEDDGTITIYLANGNASKYKIETKILSQKTFEKVKQIVYRFSNGKYAKIDQEHFPWDKIFTAGYGAGVRNLGTADYRYYVAIDALYSLFKYDVPLQNPELSMRRAIERAREKGKKEKDGGLKYAKEMQEYLTGLLKKVLNLEVKAKVRLTSTSIEIQSDKWGGRQELSTLGDGYISTTTWILDLISWWMLYLILAKKNIYNNKNIRGVVLIDELEQHLHPIWQQRILNLLKESFPKVQFIVTTHSPLVISGSNHTPIIILRNGHVLGKKENVGGWLVEDIYIEIMGLSSSRNIQIRNLFEEYKKLHKKKLEGKATKGDILKLSRLVKNLKSSLPTDDLVVKASTLENLLGFLKSE